MTKVSCLFFKFLSFHILGHLCPSSPASLPAQILVAGLKFFLGKDEDEKNDSDSDSEASTKDTTLD